MSKSTDTVQSMRMPNSTDAQSRSLRRAERYFEWLYARRRIVNTLVLALTVIMAGLSARLSLKTDFAELLPQKLPSVVALNRAIDRIGGAGMLLVGVEGPSFEANRRFVEAMRTKLDPLVGKSLRFYEYRYQDVVDYAEKYGLQYLTSDQLEEFRKHLKAEIDTQKNRAFGSLLGLDDGQSESASKADWAASLDPTFKFFLRYRDAYLSTDNGKTMVMVLRPSGSTLGMGDSVKLVAQVESIIKELNPQSFHPKMTVGLGGNVRSAIDEFETIKSDIVDTAVLLVVLILSALLLYFWSLRLVGLICLNLVVGVIFTFGLTRIFIGYLNTQTAFLGSLVAGTGINYAIIFVARYLENKKTGKNTRAAVVDAMANTAIPTLIASSTTGVSFAALLIAQNKGLSQFGFIGGVGVYCCWIAAFSLMPLWLFQLESRFPVHYRNPLGSWFHRRTVAFGDYVARHGAAVFAILMAVSLMGIPGFLRLAKNPLEYNFDNLRNKVSAKSGVEALENRISRVFPTSLTPSLVMLDSPEQAQELCPAVRALAAKLPPQDNVIHSCMSLYDLLPPLPIDPVRHQQKMAEVRDLLGNRLLKFSDDWDRIKGMRDHMQFDRPTLNDLPPQLARRFAEKDGRVGYIGFVNPNSAKPLNDGRNLLAFTQSLSDIPLPKTHTSVSATGDSFILADLLRSLRHDGPLVAGLAFLAVSLIAVLLCGGWINGGFMAFCLLCGTWWMLMVQGFWGLSFNFFNFIALPLTFGIGVDYPINVFIRCRQEGFRNYGKVLATSGMAVILCSMTTSIGYYTLVGAANQALVSFAKLALIGEFTCIVAAILMVPAALRVFGKFAPEAPAAPQPATAPATPASGNQSPPPRGAAAAPAREDHFSAQK